MTEKASSNTAPNEQDFSSDEIENLPIDKKSIIDLSRRRRLDHHYDLMQRGNWGSYPNEFIHGVRLDILTHREFVIICAIMNLPPDFLLKRTFFKGLCRNDDITKVMDKLISWGCIRVEEIPSKRGGYEKLHHTLPLECWSILSEIREAMNDRHDQSVDVRKCDVRKRGDVNKKDFKKNENENENENARARVASASLSNQEQNPKQGTVQPDPPIVDVPPPARVPKLTYSDYINSDGEPETWAESEQRQQTKAISPKAKSVPLDAKKGVQDALKACGAYGTQEEYKAFLSRLYGLYRGDDNKYIRVVQIICENWPVKSGGVKHSLGEVLQNQWEGFKRHFDFHYGSIT